MIGTNIHVGERCWRRESAWIMLVTCWPKVRAIDYRFSHVDHRHPLKMSPELKYH